MTNQQSFTAIIVAAGQGSRAGGEIPKQFQLLAGKPLLWHSIRCFSTHPLVGSIIIVTTADQLGYAESIAKSLADDLHCLCVSGGKTRQASVHAGLEAAAQLAAPPSHVLIHDAARPLPSHALLNRLMEALKQQDAVIPTTPVRDSLKRLENNQIAQSAPREGLYHAQTPQGFRLETILKAHQRHQNKELSDDASLLELDGLPVASVAGEATNIKITYQTDWDMAAAILASNSRIQTGFGFDVHRLIEAPARPLMLGGVEIASPLALEGHSDADVLLHALTDALLGAIAEGDIGTHFPPSNPEWKNADSATFIRHAVSLAQQKGAILQHADVTLIGESPKLAPHREAIRQNIAALCQLPLDAVSVKATTTEQLGFTGRGEGLAAQAVVTVKVVQ